MRTVYEFRDDRGNLVARVYFSSVAYLLYIQLLNTGFFPLVDEKKEP